MDFSLYLPDVMGLAEESVETHVTEPTEPVDVRKNRQLTLDNMKLHREVERLKSQAAETTDLKKELRSVKVKLEDEQRTRLRIETQLDRHNEKVKLIAQSMDCVEREFECRDDNIHSLERKLDAHREVIATLQNEADLSADLAQNLKADLDKSRKSERILLRQFEEAETESKELQEFLQAEKMTLAETLKDCESEIKGLKDELARKEAENLSVEERCGRLVRLNEQRRQENLTLEAQVNGVQDKAKEMLLAQGAEISRAHIQMAELCSKLEQIGGFESQQQQQQQQQQRNGDESNNGLPVSASVNNSVDSTQNAAVDEQQQIDSLTSDPELKESLGNLSRAIAQRQISENCHINGGLDKESLPSLGDRVGDVSNLVEKILIEAKKKPLQPDVVSNGKENRLNNKADNEEEINELKTKFMKHRQILVHNYEQAENEIRRLDEIYHETVQQVLKVTTLLLRYSRHRLISLWASHFWAYKKRLGLLSGGFYVVLLNKMSREKLGLLSGWAYYPGAF